jgi:hypothetical protein
LNDTTHGIAARTLLTSAAPLAPAIFTDSTLAPGATPFHLPPELAPLPAMMPATKVPGRRRRRS